MMRARTMLLLGAAALAGCGGRNGDPQNDASGEVASASSGAVQLAPSDIDRLATVYPVLGAARAPEPQPSDTRNASQPPAAVRALPERVLASVTGEATFYADRFEGARTASGIPFRQNQMVAAHRAYPFGTLLRVTNMRNDRAVNVRVVDRGPHGALARARNTIIDLSRRAAEHLGYTAAGRTPVRVEVLEWGPGVRGALSSSVPGRPATPDARLEESQG